MADISILQSAAATVPTGYTIAGAQEIVLKSVTASFDGTGAGGSYVPAVQVVDPSGHIVGTFTLQQTLAAGASADISWFPGLAGTASSTPVTGTVQVPVYLDTPDNSGNSFPTLTLSNGFTTVQRILPALSHAGDGTWVGSIPVPEDYSSTPKVIISAVTNAVAGAVRWVVGTSVIAAGGREDSAFTDETAQNVTVPGTTSTRFDSTFAITGNTPVAGASLNIRVKRNAANAGDTCTATALVWQVVFQYAR
jgi:hypothetical protein